MGYDIIFPCLKFKRQKVANIFLLLINSYNNRFSVYTFDYVFNDSTIIPIAIGGLF
jgi:hypothetical protein